jgi:hypothetical protein
MAETGPVVAIGGGLYVHCDHHFLWLRLMVNAIIDRLDRSFGT